MTDLEGGPSIAVTRTRAIYERLRREIIQGTLLPGEKLRIEVLRTRYNVGGTPLREALNRLSTEGLVTQSDQRGFRVTPVSADDLVELTRTRCWINEVALRDSIARGGRDWVERVLLALHRLSRIAVVVDGRIHPAIDHDGNARQSMKCQQNPLFPVSTAACDRFPQGNFVDPAAGASELDQIVGADRRDPKSPLIGLGDKPFGGQAIQSLPQRGAADIVSGPQHFDPELFARQQRSLDDLPTKPLVDRACSGDGDRRAALKVCHSLSPNLRPILAETQNIDKD